MTDQTISTSNTYDLSSINQNTLTPIVRSALNSQTVEIIDWNCSRVHGGAGDIGDVLSAVYRFAGTGRDQGTERDWSLILKIVGTTATHADPSEPRYWKREVLAYQSGQQADLPGSLAAPPFFWQHCLL